MFAINKVSIFQAQTVTADPVWITVQEHSKGLLSSAGATFTEEVQSRGSCETGDVVLCMPDSIKENKKPLKKEGSKTMAELQVRHLICAVMVCCL